MMLPDKISASLALLLLALVPASSIASLFDTPIIESGSADVMVVDGELIGVTGEGNHARLRLDGRRLIAAPYSPDPPAQRPDDILPDGIVAEGNGGIRRAWLGDPTRRYDHAVLGDDLEASRLIVIDRQGARHVHDLPQQQVFEDRFPRLADIDGDGTDEVIVIRSDVDRGAGIAVYSLTEAGLEEAASSAPIGMRHRWMNVVGTADFTGDGTVEIAVVVTPHIGGTLTLLRRRDGELEAVFERGGFSNHAYGSRELGMAAALELDGDSAIDIAVPDAGRRSLVLLSLAGARYRELHRIDHHAAIASGIHAVDMDDDEVLELAYVLDDGSLVVIRRDAFID